MSDQVDTSIREYALAQREQCYEIVINALRTLKGETSHREFGSPVRPATAAALSILDPASRKKYICQIIQLGVQSPDRLFHEYLYCATINLCLENELLEYGGPDLVPFLQSACRETMQEVRAVSAVMSAASPFGQVGGAPFQANQVKYSDLLARYYVSKRQHLLAAHVLVRLAEMRSTDSGDTLIIEQRLQYLSNAVLQAKNVSSNGGNGLPGGGNQAAIDRGLLDLLEGKLAVLRFQRKIKVELEAMASRLESSSSSSSVNSTTTEMTVDTDYENVVREKAKELTVDLKSITQLYNEYADPFELWEICLEMLYFANYSGGDGGSSIMREIWGRLIDQALSNGGVTEACSLLKRVGSNIYPGDGGAVLPLDSLCLHLEKAALERWSRGVETAGDEDVARALLAACKGAAEAVLNTYDQMLSNRGAAMLPSPSLRLRLLRSVLVVLREWAMSARRTTTTIMGSPLIFGAQSFYQAAATNQGVRDKITSATNRYMTEVRRLPLAESDGSSILGIPRA